MSKSRGLRNTGQGEIAIQVLYNTQAQEIYGKNSGPSLYRSSSDKSTYHIKTGDILFEPKNIKTPYDHPCVLSSLNGMGSDAYDRFPNDENMQREYIMSTINLVGVSTSDYSPDVNNNPDFASSIGGARTLTAYVNMPFGVSVEVIAPTKEMVKNMLAENGNAKIPLIGVPHDPKTIGTRMSIHMREFLKNQANYTASFKTFHTQHSKRLTALNTRVKSAMMHGIILMDQLCKANIMDININVGAFKFDNGIANNTEKLLGLAMALGLFGEDTYNINNVTISAEIRERYSRLARQISMAQFWDGTTANLGFGFDNATGVNVGIDTQTGHIKRTTAAGRMLELQFTLHQAEVASFNDFIRSQKEFIIGKNYRSSNANGLYMIL